MAEEYDFAIPQAPTNKKKPRRSSILKKPLTELQNVGDMDDKKRRVSFLEKVMVKEYHKTIADNADEEHESIHSMQTRRAQMIEEHQQTENEVYMIPANQSFYQMSTPLGDHKKRRLSANPVSRLSVIPCELERSFANNELDPPDFEVFEDNSDGSVSLPKSNITLTEPEIASSPPINRITNDLGSPMKDCPLTIPQPVGEETVYDGVMSMTDCMEDSSIKLPTGDQDRENPIADCAVVVVPANMANASCAPVNPVMTAEEPAHTGKQQEVIINIVNKSDVVSECQNSSMDLVGCGDSMELTLEGDSSRFLCSPSVNSVFQSKQIDPEDSSPAGVVLVEEVVTCEDNFEPTLSVLVSNQQPVASQLHLSNVQTQCDETEIGQDAPPKVIKLVQENNSQKISTDNQHTSRMPKVTLPVARPPAMPAGFKRSRHILPNSIVSKRLAIGRGSNVLYSPALSQPSRQPHQLPVSTHPPMKSPTCATLPILKRSSKAHGTPVVVTSSSPEHPPLSMSRVPHSNPLIHELVNPKYPSTKKSRSSPVKHNATFTVDTDNTGKCQLDSEQNKICEGNDGQNWLTSNNSADYPSLLDASASSVVADHLTAASQEVLVHPKSCSQTSSPHSTSLVQRSLSPVQPSSPPVQPVLSPVQSSPSTPLLPLQSSPALVRPLLSAVQPSAPPIQTVTSPVQPFLPHPSVTPLPHSSVTENQNLASAQSDSIPASLSRTSADFYGNSQSLQIATPEMVLLDSTLQSKTMSPLPILSETYCSADQSRFDHASDKSVRIVSPETLDKFVKFADADRTLNLGDAFALQLQLEENVKKSLPVLSVEEQQEVTDSDALHSPNKKIVDKEIHSHSEIVPSSNKSNECAEIAPSSNVNDDCTEVVPSSNMGDDCAEVEQGPRHSSVEPEVKDFTNQKVTTESMQCSSSTNLIQVLEEVHDRLKVLHSRTSARVSLKSYAAKHKELRHFLEHFYSVMRPCVCTVRCLIDYVRLADMAEAPCAVTVSKDSELPLGDDDIKGELMQQATWIDAMGNDLAALYLSCQALMKSTLQLCGWYISKWGENEVEVNFRKNVALTFTLDPAQFERGGYGVIPCQKIINISIDNPDNCDIPKGLKCSSVLEIPLVLQKFKI